MNEQQQRALAAGLRALAASTNDASASLHVEAAVMAGFEQMTGPAAASRPVTSRPGGAWFAIAAALTLACVTGIWVSQGAGERGAVYQEAGFAAIPGTAYLPPMESGSIVRVALPVTALPSYGIQIGPDMTNETVDADLLIAQDGLARGIRLVNDSQTRSTP
jgi:hypothetical protein